MMTNALPSQPAPSGGLLWSREELRRRLELASEACPEPASRPSLRRFVAEIQWVAEPFRRPFRTIEVVPAQEPRTVMLLPGFATHPFRMKYMAKQLERAGHKVKRWGLGYNFGPSEDNFAFLEQRLLVLHERYGRPVYLVGWSLGGLFARELAKTHPEIVAKVVSMGSPFSGNPRANNVWRAYQFIAGHRVDTPPVKAAVAVKPPVETVALWSPRDGIISPRSAAGYEGERDRAVCLRCTHMGFTYSPDAIHAVLRELEVG